jgi:protein-L-isoaspartate O-methyltransferase
MTDNIRSKRNYVALINASILMAMEVVPRHLFMEAALIRGTTKEKMKIVYNLKKPMKATMWSQESAAEVIGVQLSLVALNPGMNVLIVGGKGGYINSLVAQVVGTNGQVFTVSSNRNILDVAKQRVDRWSPLAGNMKWVPIESVAPNFKGSMPSSSAEPSLS